MTDQREIPQQIEAVRARLGYEFKNPELLVRALTHASAVDSDLADNERLEFLGDRVLGLVIAHRLIEKYPGSAEGLLARRLNELVRKETCAEVADQFELGRALILDVGEARSGGRKKKALLGDACEAVIAAIYLDGGLSPAQDFIDRAWSPHFEKVKKIAPDAKTALQEWSHKAHGVTPVYHLDERSGPDHAPEFKMSVSVADLASEVGKGQSKREAEQSAAEALLRREGVWT